MVKNGHDFLGHWALQSAVSQELFDELRRICGMLIQIQET